LVSIPRNATEVEKIGEKDVSNDVGAYSQASQIGRQEHRGDH